MAKQKPPIIYVSYHDPMNPQDRRAYGDVIAPTLTSLDPGRYAVVPLAEWQEMFDIVDELRDALDNMLDVEYDLRVELDACIEVRDACIGGSE